MSAFDIGALLFLFATAIGIVNERYLHLSNVIAQLLGAMAISLIIILVGYSIGNVHFTSLLERRVDDAHLPKIFLDGVLALLLFASSLQIDLANLRKNALTVFCLATLGVMLSCA